MKLKAIAAAVVAAPLVVACGSTEKAETFSLNGAGASFPAMLYQNWTQSFAKDTGNQVNYQAVGSGAGVRQFKAKTVDFGASDGAVSDAKQPPEGMVHIPMTGGAIVPTYNYPGCEVKMTQTELADVFLGKITNCLLLVVPMVPLRSFIVLMVLVLLKDLLIPCLHSLLSGKQRLELVKQ